MVHARQAARAARDWAEADRLKTDIEAAGWTVVDRAGTSRAAPAHAPNVVEGDAIRYGWSGAVPSVLDEPPSGPVSVVVLQDDPDVAEDEGALGRTLDGLRAILTDGPGVIVVDASRPAGAGPSLDGHLGEAAAELVRLAAGLGPASALEAGIRRARGAVIVVLRAGVVPGPGLVERLVEALADPTVAIVGARGFASSDLIRLIPVPPGDVAAVDASCCAFRRADAAARLRLDERLRTRSHVDAWLSLMLRDEGPDRMPRRAVVLGDLAVELGPEAALAPTGRDRAARRDAYRILDAFRGRGDLAVEPAALAGTGADSAGR